MKLWNRRKAQPAIEYLLALGMGVVFVTIIAYFVKNAVQ